MNGATRRTFGLDVPVRLSGPVELVLSGLEQHGGSYEVRVFVNNPGADERTPVDSSSRYLGSVHVYGYGNSPRSEAPSGGHPGPRSGAILPIEKRLRIPVAEQSALAGFGGKRVALNLVLVAPGGSGREPARQPLLVERIALESK